MSGHGPLLTRKQSQLRCPAKRFPELKEAVWPDVKQKVAQFLQKLPKSSHSSSWYYVNWTFLKIAKKVAKYFDNFNKKMFCPNVSEVAQSGQTDWGPSFNPIFNSSKLNSFCVKKLIEKLIQVLMRPLQ